MGEHAKYGGSTIKRTGECPGWVEFCAPLPNLTSEYADEGTLLHNAMQRVYTEDVAFNSREVIGMDYEGIVLTELLYAEKIFPAINAVEDIFEKYDIQDFTCESRVIIADNIWGTADLIGVGTCAIAGHTLKVGLSLDYKFGSGVLVSAHGDPSEVVEAAEALADIYAVDGGSVDILASGNQQGLFYAVGASMTPPFSEFFEGIDMLVVAIVQPNDRGLEDYTLWEVDGQLLPEAYQRILAVCKRAEQPGAPFKSGDHCRFCSGRGLCPATSGEVSAILRLDVTAPDLIKHIPTFEVVARTEQTIKALRILVHNQIEEGVEIPGWKIVPKRASRSYTDESAAELVAKKSRKLKREEVYAMKFLSPPQMEKLLKAKGLDFEALFGSLVKKVSSGTTLASADDSREASPGLGALKAILDRD